MAYNIICNTSGGIGVDPTVAPATPAIAWFYLFKCMVTASWAMKGSSDGTTFSTSSMVVTHGGSGSGGFDNAGAWVRAQAADGREICVQRNTTTGANTSQSVRIKYSISGTFVSGSPGATRVPSAADEAIVFGGGTDASPTFSRIVGGTDGTHYYRMGASSVFPWTLYWAAYKTSLADTAGEFIYDYAFSTALGDRDPYVFGAAAGDGAGQSPYYDNGNLGFTGLTWATWLGYGTGAQSFTNVVLSVPASRATANQRSLDCREDYFTSKGKTFTGVYYRPQDQVGTNSYKGVSSTIWWIGRASGSVFPAMGSTMSVTGSSTRERIIIADVSLQWDGSVISGSTDYSYDAPFGMATSSVDISPPTITLFSPVTGSMMSVSQSVSFIVVDNSGSVPLINVSARYNGHPSGSRLVETIFDGTAYVEKWAASSSIVTSPTGSTLTIKREHGWPDSFSLLVKAVDQFGNVGSGTFPYTINVPALPVISNVSSSPVSYTGSISFDLNDPEGLFSLSSISARYVSRSFSEEIYDSGFLPPFFSGSSITSITSGSRFTVARTGSWIDSFILSVVSSDILGTTGSLSATFIVSGAITPTVSNYLPTSSLLSPTASIQFDATDLNGLSDVVTSVYFPLKGFSEVIHSASAFSPAYDSSSSRTAIANGFRYLIVREENWPDDVQLTVDAIDSFGLRSSTSRAWTLDISGQPTVTNFFPATGSTIFLTSSISFDVECAGPFRRILLIASYGGSSLTPEVIHDGGDFRSPFSGSSTRTTISFGYHYVVSRSGSWPVGTNSITVEPYAIDKLGTENP